MGVSRAKVRALCRTGALPGAIHQGRNRWLIPVSALSAQPSGHHPPRPNAPHAPMTAIARLFKSRVARALSVSLASLTLVSVLADWRGCTTQLSLWYTEVVGEFPAAHEGELLVVVFRFHRPPGSPDTEPHQEIARALRAAAGRQPFRNRFRVETSFTDIPVDAVARARDLGKRYRASLVVWGADTGVRVTVNFFDLLNERSLPTTITTTDSVLIAKSYCQVLWIGAHDQAAFPFRTLAFFSLS